jgi:nicotinamidase-related amidase
MNEYILINVDTQKDFFEGSFTIKGSEKIIDNLSKITKFAKDNYIKVINTACWYDDKTKHLSEMPDFVETFPPHCIMGTDGAKFIKETQPEKLFVIDWANPQGMSLVDMHKSREIAITKNKMNPIDGNPYGETIIHNLGVPINQRPKFIIYGVNIVSTVLPILRRGYEVIVVSDANINFNGSNFDISELMSNPQETVKNIEFITTVNLTK